MSFLRRLFGLERKASATGTAVSYWTQGQPVYTPRNYDEFAREAYVRNAVAHRCIAMIAQAAASVPFMAVDGRSGDELDGHPALALLGRPNPMEPGAALMERFVSFYLIAGNAYLEAVGPSPKAPPREVWALRPDRMRVVPGPQAMPVRYEYEANGITVRFDVDPVTGRSPIMHLAAFNPIDDFYGLSSVDPASYAIDRHNEAAHHNMAVLQNGATPSGAMVFKPVTVDKEIFNAPDTAIKRAEERIAERYSGSGNAGRPMVFGGNVEWQSFGMTMEQLQLVESKLDAARDICIAFGVPIALLLPGQTTYNNVREAKLAFYTDTVIPLTERVRDALNSWLMPRYDDRTRLVLDLDEIEALAPLREIRQQQTIALYGAGLIGLDEARGALQWGPADERIRAELMLARRADAATKLAAAFTSDINAGVFDETALRTARAAQLAEAGIYPAAERLAVDPAADETVDPAGGADPAVPAAEPPP